MGPLLEPCKILHSPERYKQFMTMFGNINVKNTTVKVWQDASEEGDLSHSTLSAVKFNCNK